MYISSAMLMALYEDRVRRFDRRALDTVLPTVQPGRAQGGWTRSLATWAGTVLRARAAAAARQTGTGATGARA